MKVLVTGATGFTGSYVVPRLLSAGLTVRCFARDPEKCTRYAGDGVEVAIGDLDDPASLERSLLGCDALVNVASLGFGHAPKILHAVQRAKVRRAVFISTTAVFTSLDATSKVVRLAAERDVIGSGLNYTILRPTMIYGSSRDRNICRLINFLQRWPVIPVFGSGEFLQQPVYVGDLVEAIVKALLTPESQNKCYNISGLSALTYNQLIDTVCRLLGRKVRKLHLPAKLVVANLKIVERFTRRLPIKAEQIERLNEHKAFEHSEAGRDFGYEPRSFADGVALELAGLGLTR